MRVARIPTATLLAKNPMESFPIAVIGLSARYAGNVQNPDDLWRHLQAGIDPIKDFPEGRWDKGFLDADRNAPGRSYTFAGGYLEQIDSFDADFFGISPREAAQMDPQQRLLLELAWEAFEDAGLVPSALAGSKTGVYVGLSSRDYAEVVNEEIVNAYTNLGLSMSIASNRVSYIFDLKGPSMTVDTACSSGMVALHQAMVAMRRGECSQALVGAVNLLLSPASYIGFSKASMLSPAGRCTSFDANGAGYVRAEGGGFLMLKPLADAERDGDRIMGVILASGVNSDGRTMGIALPNPVAQAALLRQVYEEAGIKPDEVYYLEAHGTGTAVGDPIECEAIANVLGKEHRGEQPLRIGSIKSNVGHLENGAGIAGITKVLLALKHREIPANLHFKTPNPKIDFQGWKLEVVHQPHPLPQTEKPLNFGINSFGFGGTNGHCVIQEYRPSKPMHPTVEVSADKQAQPDLLVLSAQSETALAAVAHRWIDHLQNLQAVDWPALRANAIHHRSHLGHRLVLEAPTSDSAVQRLRAWLNDGRTAGEKPVSGLLVGKAPLAAVDGGRLRTAFVFAGNGPQWWAMGRELLQAHALFREAVQEVDGIFSKLAGWSLLDELLRDEADSSMAKTEVAQPTLFAIQVGLTRVLREAGIEADAVIGHSVGEAAAAWASGALSLEQATHVIHQRSLAQSATAGMGRMAALGVSADEARRCIERVGGFLEIAAINSPSAVTVAGDPVQLQTLCEQLTEAGRFARMLTLDYPFHTKAMDGIRDGLVQSLADLTPGACASTCAFVSTVEGRAIEGHQLGATYWWRNIREPVAFEAGVTHLLGELGVTGFIEISPHPVLRDYVLQTAKARDTAVQLLTTLRRPREGQAVSETEQMREAVLSAYAQGLADPRQLAHRPTMRLPMPLYAWHRQRHWRGASPLAGMVRARLREHPLLGWRATDIEPSWEQVLDRSRLGFLADHVIQDAALYPGAGYIEMALAAGRSLMGDIPLQLEDLDFLKPMTLPSSGLWPRVHTGVDAADGTCEIATRDHDETTVHARCRITRAELGHRPPPMDVEAARAAMSQHIDAATHYAGTARRGMHYGSLFQGVKLVSLCADDSLRAIARIELPEAFGDAEAALRDYRSHPAVLDACLQALVTLLARRDQAPLACIPVRVERLRSFAPLPSVLWCDVTLLHDSPRAGRARFVLYNDIGECVLVADGTSLQKVDFRAGQEPPHLADRWRPDTAGALPLPAAVGVVTLTTPQSTEQPRWAREDGVLLDGLCGAIAVQTLQRLHSDAGLPAGEAFVANALWRRARVPAELRPLAAALLQMAQEDGWMTASDEGVQFVSPPPNVDALWRSAMRQRPVLTAELMLLLPLVDRLVSCLAPDDSVSQDDTARAAASGPNPSFLEFLGDSAPFMADAHAVLGNWLQQLLAAHRPERVVRVLQLHAGRTGAAAVLLPHVPAVGVDFAVSEVDEGRVEQLQRQHGAHPAVRAVVHSLARHGDEEAIAGPVPWVDVVIAGDGLQAAGMTPAAALSRLADTVAPGGWLLLAAPQPGRLVTLLFGHQAHWWNGEQAALPQQADWQALLEQAGGWEQVHTLGAGPCTVVAARRRSAAARTAAADKTTNATAETTQPTARGWLLLADAAGLGADFASAVAEELTGRGQTVRRLVISGDEDAPDLAKTIVAAAEEQDVVVQLAGLAERHDDPLVIQMRRCVPLLALAHSQQLADDMLPKPLKVRLVSHGAQPGPAGGANFDPAQAAAWGLARVLSNEHPGLELRAVDLQVELNAHSARRLAAELVLDSPETEVLLAADGRWINRVERAVTQPTITTPAEGVRLVNGSGGLDSLTLCAVERQAPGVGEVEIAVRAAGLNFRDVLWAMNMLPEEAVSNGFSGATIGMECAGTVSRVGPGVEGLTVGDRVIGFASGCFASHVTTSAGAVGPIPEGMGFEEAATVPTTFLTAWYALTYLARLEPGERVLVHGAAGGVGLAALQIAKARGAVVFATAGNDDKRRLALRYGADHVLDSRSLAFADDVMAITGGEGLDVVLNSLAGEAITKNLQILRPFGRLLEIGKRDLYANSRIGLRPFRINISYFGIDADTLLVERPVLARRMFSEVLQALREGTLRPLPYQALPITRAATAFRQMQRSRHVGKLVLTLPAPGMALPAVAPRPWQASTDGTWLVTGGLGGFGLATAKWLVTRGVRSLALMSRRGASTEEAQTGIAFLQAAGATVRAFAADVSQEADVARVLAEVRSTMAPLKGVLHAAMVLDDGPVHTLDKARLQRVLAPKLHGAWHLHRLTQTDPLESFVVFSSATIMFGNPGQGNYVAANQYLQAFAQWRRAQGLPALSVAWGAIRDVGIVTRVEGLEQMLQKRSGIAALDAADALVELGKALAAGEVASSVSAMDMSRASILWVVRAPRMAALRPAGADTLDSGGQTLAERWPGVAADARRPLLLDVLRSHLSRILGTPAAQIDIERPLADLGLDSLMAVELAGSLEHEMGRPVSVMQMIQASSTAAVVDLLANSLGAASSV